MRLKTVLASAFVGSTLLLSGMLAHALEVGQHAPCVVLNDIQADNNVINQCIRTPLNGARFVMIEFFLTTCPDCNANLPKVSSLAESIAATTTTRLVGIDRDANATRTYIQSHRDLIRFPASIDNERNAKKAYDVSEVPTIFILDSNNNVIYKYADILNESEIAKIQALVR